MVKFSLKEVKSVLNVKKGIDFWFWDKYSINPYNGCSFGCIYCDARSNQYQMPQDFENNILVKKNIRTLLDQRLTRAKKLLPDVVGIGGVTDSYQPVEKLHLNTRNCLEVLHKHHYPIHIATKSLLIERDLDVISAIGIDTWATISISISSTDREIADFIDCRSPAPRKRFELISTIKKYSQNIQTGILLMPMVPFLSDNNHNLEDMVKQSKDAGADYLLFSGMTMHDTQARWFLGQLEKKHPLLLSPYKELFQFGGDMDSYNGLFSTPKHYLKAKESMLLELCEKHGLPVRIRRYLPSDFRKYNYLVAEKLLNDYYFQQLSGQENKELFWAAHNIHKLNESILNVAKRGELSSIWNVKGDILQKVKSYLE